MNNRKINELTDLNKSKMKRLEPSEREQVESKEMESVEVTVYQRDEFGLPQAQGYQSSTANSSLAISIIKKGRSLEKAGKLEKALSYYQRAKVLVPNHQGLQKKIDKLLISSVDLFCSVMFSPISTLSSSLKHFAVF